LSKVYVAMPTVIKGKMATICGYNDGTKMTKRGLIDAEARELA
jgi:hypothetical protein